MTATAEPNRRPNYVSRGTLDDFKTRLNAARASLGDLVEDLSGWFDEGERLALDDARWILGVLRDCGNREREIHEGTARVTDPWTPGVQWEPDYIALTSQVGVAASFLTPNVSAVLRLDNSQANQVDDALDSVAIQLERFRRLLVSRRTELPGGLFEAEAEGEPPSPDRRVADVRTEGKL